jgi:hypothetical protein
LRGVRPIALKTVRRSRQLPRMAPSMQAFELFKFLVQFGLTVG